MLLARCGWIVREATQDCIGGRRLADDNLLDQNRLPPSPATPAIKFPALRSLPPAFMLIISIAGGGGGGIGA